MYPKSGILIDMKKVLVIDDEVDICYFLIRNLNKQHYPSTYVNNLKDAKLAVESENPSILLLDNHLPDGYGVDFAKEVKEIHPDIKIVMITAHDSNTDRATAKNNGIDYFIQKPFLISEVFNAIDWVNRKAS